MIATYAPTDVVAVPTLEPLDRRGDLDIWEDAIADLNIALRDCTDARREIEGHALTLERLEASAVLAIEGGNAEQRKARLTLALADDARYCGALADQRAARDRLADADRRVIVAKERCRLLRAALALDAA